MKKWQIVLLTAVIILVAVVGVWYFLVSKDKREVRRLVNEAAALISKKADNAPHAGILKHSKTDVLFCETVVFKISKPNVNLTVSRDELKNRVALLLRMTEHMQVGVDEISVEVSENSAVFSCAVEVSGKTKLKKETFSDVYTCTGSAEKIDGKWYISSMAAEPVLL